MKPKLVAEIKFTEWTAGGEMRHPVFLGLCTQRDLDAAIEKSGGTKVPPEQQLESISELP